MLAATFIVLFLMLSFTAYLAGGFHEAEAARGRLHASRAQALAEAGDFDASIDEYREALTYVRDSPDYRLRLAVALYDTDRWEEAKTHFSELLVGDPTLAEPNLYLARIAERRNDLNQAINHYRTAVYGRWPSDPVQRRIQTRFELMSLLERQGEQAHAVAELGELMAEEPDNAAVANRVAWSFLGLGAPAQALGVFERLVEGDPRDAVAHSGIAEAEFELHHYLTARTHFARSLALNPRLTHLRSRMSLTDQINALDPTIRGLGRVSRYERSLVLIDRAGRALDTCVPPPPEPDSSSTGRTDAEFESQSADVERDQASVSVPVDVQEIRSLVRDWLEEHSGRTPDDDATERNTILAERLWETVRAHCPQVDAADEPLDRVLAKIASLGTE